MTEIAPDLILFLFAAAFLAGFIDSIAGGGGLIAIPALLLAGLPPLETLGTAKLQALFGSGSAAYAYRRKGYVEFKSVFPMSCLSFVGAVFGALLAIVLPVEFLEGGLTLLLVVIAVYFAVKPDAGAIDRQRRLSFTVFGATFIPAIAFYDGLFGPGAGSFYMLAFVSLAGFNMLKATAHTKVVNFASNVGGLLVFLVSGAILWKVGFIMGVGQICGSLLGSRLAIKRGAKIIRPLLVVTCIAMALNLLRNQDSPVYRWLGMG
ncbi:MAG: putative permease [Saliniramus fredricksonii]|uniref:Probable membrane transporter protein n=1 Tax=Saliniramus fredricksonii TaxID=1653334 RepID=A0A0N8KDV9_9HYPH|nr:TSUP family transporter [Saliniramus fredricksonii]KPQ09626.1 MAG: putative permease [Saliniramus fredricksonii]SCC78402.1 hypothetical protein GA0071312_0264 [Saliniramus fredricksonii]